MSASSCCKWSKCNKPRVPAQNGSLYLIDFDGHVFQHYVCNAVCLTVSLLHSSIWSNCEVYGQSMTRGMKAERGDHRGKAGHVDDTIQCQALAWAEDVPQNNRKQNNCVEKKLQATRLLYGPWLSWTKQKRKQRAKWGAQQLSIKSSSLKRNLQNTKFCDGLVTKCR